MKVCLINPPDLVVEDACWDEPLGLLYLGAVLENAGVDVEVVDLNFHQDLTPLTNVEADYLGVYCSSSLLASTLEVNQFLKETHPEAKRIVGGPHATCVPEDLTPHFNSVIVGEGERAIFKALTSNQPIIRMLPIKNLDEIPYPARHLVPIHDYHRRVEGRQCTGMITSRGCPHACAFCSKVWGRTTRFRSVENVLGEVEECIDKHGIKAFSMRDDTFTLRRKRLLEILEGFNDLDIKWRCLTRVDHIDECILNHMKNSGCVEIAFGVESGNQQILNNLNKQTTVEQNVEAIKMMKEIGIRSKPAVIIGSPGETWETVRDTIRFIEDNLPDAVMCCIFTPYPGSAVWNDPDSFGMKILTRDVNKYAAVGPDMTGNVVVETESMTADDIRKAHQMALNRFKELGLVPK